jgi:hypothetical protein
MPLSLLTLESTVSRQADILAAPVGDEIVLASIDAGLFCGLDEIGADLWRRLSQPCTVAALAAAMAEAYDGAPDEIAEDVVAALGRLHEAGFVTVT